MRTAEVNSKEVNIQFAALLARWTGVLTQYAILELQMSGLTFFLAQYESLDAAAKALYRTRKGQVQREDGKKPEIRAEHFGPNPDAYAQRTATIYVINATTKPQSHGAGR